MFIKLVKFLWSVQTSIFLPKVVPYKSKEDPFAVVRVAFWAGIISWFMGSVALLIMLIDAPVSMRNVDSILFKFPIIIGWGTDAQFEKMLKQLETPVIFKLFCANAAFVMGAGNWTF